VLPPTCADGSATGAVSLPRRTQALEFPSTRASRRWGRVVQSRRAPKQAERRRHAVSQREIAYKGKGKRHAGSSGGNGPAGCMDRGGCGPAGSGEGGGGDHRPHGGEPERGGSTFAGLAGGLAGRCREADPPCVGGSDAGGAGEGGSGGGGLGGGGSATRPAKVSSSDKRQPGGGAKGKGAAKGAGSRVGGWGRIGDVIAPSEAVCDFCPRVNRNGGTLPSALLGPFPYGNGAKVIHIHELCASWAPEVFHDPETDELSNVAAAYCRSRRLICTVCSSNGATVGCYVPSCTSVYHFKCLYGFPAPSIEQTANDIGPCLRIDTCRAAFCPAHVGSAKAPVYMQRMEADAALSLFLNKRAAAVAAALNGDPGLGTDSPSFAITGLRRNETETIFCRVWGVASEAPSNAAVTIVGRPPLRRVLQRGERLALRDAPRLVRRTALELLFGRHASREAGGGTADGASAAPEAEAVARSSGLRGEATEVGGRTVAAPPPRTPVLLLRNLRQCRPLSSDAVRLSLPAVPTSYLTTTVVLPEGAPVPPSGLGGPSPVDWCRPTPVPLAPALEGGAANAGDKDDAEEGQDAELRAR